MDLDTSALAVPPKNHRQTRILEHLKSIKRSASPLDRQHSQQLQHSGRKPNADLSSSNDNLITAPSKDKASLSATVASSTHNSKAAPVHAKRPVGRPRKSPNAPAKPAKQSSSASKPVVLSSLVGEPSLINMESSSPQRTGEPGQLYQQQHSYPTPYTASNIHTSLQRQQQAAMPVSINLASTNLQKMSTAAFYHSSTAPEAQRHGFPSSTISSLPSTSSVLASPISPNFSIPSTGSSPSLASNFSAIYGSQANGYDMASASLYNIPLGERVRPTTASTSSSGNGTPRSRSSGHGGKRSRALSSATAAGASTASAGSPYLPYKALSSLSMQSLPSSASVAGMSSSFAMSSISAKSTNTSPISNATSSGLTLSMSSDGRACIAASNSAAATPLNMSRSASHAPYLSRTTTAQSFVQNRPAQRQNPPSPLQQNIMSVPTMLAVQPVVALPRGSIHAPVQSLSDNAIGPLVFSDSSLSSTGSSFPVITPPIVVDAPMLYDAPLIQYAYTQSQPLQQSMSRQVSTTGGKRPIALAPSIPFYPDKEQLHSSWKFPLVGLNLTTSPQNDSTTGHSQDTSPPLSGVHSTFPTLDAMNNPTASPERISPRQNVVMDVDSAEQASRKSRIEAWLNSPEMASPSLPGVGHNQTTNNTDASWSTLPARWDNEDGPGSLVMRSPDSPSSAPNLPITPFGSMAPLDLTIRPATSMDGSASTHDVLRSSVAARANNAEYHAMQDGIRVSGKSVTILKASRKRRLDEEEAASAAHESLRSSRNSGSLLKMSKGNNTAEEPASPTKRKGNTSKLGAAFTLAAPTMKKGMSAPGLAAMDSKKNKSTASKEAKRKGRSRADSKTSVIECFCQNDEVEGSMVQCDTCRTWFHLQCLKIDENDLPKEWFCSRCSCVSLPLHLQKKGNVDDYSMASMHYPSPESPMRRSASNPGLQKLSEGHTPETPRQSLPMREPTFSQNATPKVDYKTHFHDTHLALAPSPRPGLAPVTPHQPLSQDFVPRHAYTHSLSRQYAPSTPYVGISAGIAASAPHPGYANKGMQNGFMTDNYSPRTPNVNMTAPPAANRRPTRHTRAQSSVQFVWDGLPDRDDMNSNDPTSANIAKWEAMYSGFPTSLLHIPSTPPMTFMHTGNAVGFPHHDPLLPSVDPAEADRQRFLELTSTPSTNWRDMQQFSSPSWM